MLRQTLEGRVVAIYSAWCDVACNDQVLRCRLRGRLRQAGLDIVAGDLVSLAGTGEELVIEKVHPRKNLLARPPVANVDQAVVVTAVTQPPAALPEIDKVLVQLEQEGIHGVVCVNKSDLEDPDSLERLAGIYRAAGYPCQITSAFTGAGLEELASLMEGKVTILAGASGVGKSKILEALLGIGLATQPLSRRGRGRHTTRGVTLYTRGRGGYLADTPGFSRIDLVDCEPHELSYFYPEMAPHVVHCHYPRCLHNTEDQCRVKDALDQGLVHPERYASYLILLEESIERMKRRYV